MNRIKRNCYIVLILFVLSSCFGKKDTYVCPPCGLACDTLSFHRTGTCPHCKMDLVDKATLLDVGDQEHQIKEIRIKPGSGKFLVDGGSHPSKIIEVHYHMPSNFTKASKVLLVLPGAGRNANDYRDAWKKASEAYGVLVLALGYPEKYYPGFWSYNLAGMLYDIDFEKETFKVNAEPSKWIFDDFDRIFKGVKETLGLKEDSYDMFGHSAGGQLLHRFALFGSANNANRIVAANSGWYTLPIAAQPFPYGLGDAPFENRQLNFDKQVTVFLGENDDASETRGHLRHGPVVDKQGTHRLARGIYFFKISKSRAKDLKKPFHWHLEIVPNVGHDYKKIAAKAALYLYTL